MIPDYGEIRLVYARPWMYDSEKLDDCDKWQEDAWHSHKVYYQVKEMQTLTEEDFAETGFKELEVPQYALIKILLPQRFKEG